MTAYAPLVREIREELKQHPGDDKVPVFRGRLEAMKANSERFRANPSSYLDYGVDSATADNPVRDFVRGKDFTTAKTTAFFVFF